MVRTAVAIIFVTTMLAAFPAQASRQSHPFAGIGLLVIRPLSIEDPDTNDPMPVYEEPGIKRIAELKPTALRPPFTSMRVSSGNFVTAVMDKKGEWLKIAYDDADREGWVRMKGFWQFIPWRDLLKDRHATLLTKPGLRGRDVHAECSEDSESIAFISPASGVRIVEVDGDWITVQSGPSGQGCVRWRDGDGRFLIFPEGSVP